MSPHFIRLEVLNTHHITLHNGLWGPLCVSEVGFLSFYTASVLTAVRSSSLQLESNLVKVFPNIATRLNKNNKENIKFVF